MKNGTYNEIVKPIVVLVAICLLISALLGLTNAITAPIIEKNKELAALETRKALLPDAVGFELVEHASDSVDSIYKDTGDTGYVVTVSRSGYGGEVVTMIAISNEGDILGISVTATSETTGIGSKVALPDFTDQFNGYNSSSDPADVISGATYSSRAVINGVNAALEAFASVKGA